MTQTTHRLFDDFARLMTDAAGVARGIRREAESVVRSQVERFINDMDLVRRDDYEALREMCQRTREEADALAARVAALEARLAALGEEAAARPARSRRSTKTDESGEAQ
jgi:BMFP domain-containing protein YqiC